MLIINDQNTVDWFDIISISSHDMLVAAQTPSSIPQRDICLYMCARKQLIPRWTATPEMGLSCDQNSLEMRDTSLFKGFVFSLL